MEQRESKNDPDGWRPFASRTRLKSGGKAYPRRSGESGAVSGHAAKRERSTIRGW